MTSDEVSKLLGVESASGYVRGLCVAGPIVDPSTNKPVERKGRDWNIPRPFWLMDGRGKGSFKVYGADGREEVLMLRTREPSEWRVVDLDTGEVSGWRDGALVPATEGGLGRPVIAAPPLQFGNPSTDAGAE